MCECRSKINMHTASHTLRVLALASALSAVPAVFGQFINGGFEDGNFNAWTRGSGYLSSGQLTDNLNPSDFFSGGMKYNAGADASGIVTAGLDANTDNHLNRVYSGNYSARVNDGSQDYSVSGIRQTVTNYTDSNIFFAWAAVLEDSHGPTDSDVFKLTLTDDTTNSVLYNVTYNSATAPIGLFTESSAGWFYTEWQVQNLDVSALSGHTFTLSLLASDCPYGGHAGYVYLDGFGSVLPPAGPGPGAVPEPSTYGLFGAAALLGLIAYRRRFNK